MAPNQRPATPRAPSVADLLRADLRELGPYPGDASARLRYRPGAEVRAAMAAAVTRVAGDLEASATLEAGADLKLCRRERLTTAIARATGVASAEIAPFASLATLFSVLCSAFPARAIGNRHRRCSRRRGGICTNGRRGRRG